MAPDSSHEQTIRDEKHQTQPIDKPDDLDDTSRDNRNEDLRPSVTITDRVTDEGDEDKRSSRQQNREKERKRQSDAFERIQMTSKDCKLTSNCQENWHKHRRNYEIAAAIYHLRSKE